MAIQKFSIAKNDDIYEAFPDLVLTDDNQLITVFLECKHHSDRSYTRVMMSKSIDRGRTWNEKQPFTGPSYDKSDSWNCPRISKMKNGTLAVLVDKPEFNENSNGRTFLWLGDQYGKDWSEAILLPSNGIVPDRLLETAKGRWIISAHHKNEKGFLTQKMWFSDDKGITWSPEITIAEQENFNFCEGSIIEVEENVLICFLRENSGRGDDCYKCISYDNGETWEGAYAMPIPACHRPVAGQLNSGYYMITHRYMQGGKGWVGFWTQNVFAAFMNKESLLAKERNQQASRIIPLDYDRSPVSDIGYSGWVQFDDGEIYVAYYIVDDSPNGQIRGISFTEDDVIIGGFAK
ncbi:MAG: exo-alpha-sialidase [Clostridia bacterium]|nr:exo-alpha-sialidase [Clostridia bacterium]